MSTRNCAACGRPRTRVRFQTPGGVRFDNVLFGNRVALLSCPSCGALWCFSRQGLRGAPACGLPWPWDREGWQQAYDRDDGVLLGRWHLATLRDVCRQGHAPRDPPDGWGVLLESFHSAEVDQKIGPPPDLSSFLPPVA